MKKILIFSLISIFSLSFISCDDTTTDPVVETTGTIMVDSDPQGSEIWLDGVNTNQVTPATIDADAGVRTVTLKKEGYEDLEFPISVEAGNESVVTSNTLIAIVQTFSTPVRIWETTGTTADQPSGLDLSSGNAFGTSNTEKRDSIDIYYYSSSDGSTFLVQSSHLNTNMSRETYFLVSSTPDLNDGEDSSVKDDSWTDSMSDSETNYVFLLDADGHYSKLKIVNRNLGTGPGDPSWVEVSWIYNTVSGNTTF